MRTNLLESLSDNIVIDKDKCTACGICVNTCIMDNLRMKLAPCRQACPLGVNCQGYVQLIAREKEEEAAVLLRETLPFPGILGRVCTHPCEAGCHHNTTGSQPVAIKHLKRYLADRYDPGVENLPEMAASTGKKMAITGSGPSGLMAAWDLRVRGHEVTIFDSESEPGGMLRWAIPEFRLPTNVLEQEIDQLRKMGVDFQCNVRIGADKRMDDLKREFDAVILATGCPDHGMLNTKGEDLPGIYHGLPFLKAARSGKKADLGNEVVIIGGGNVAVDSAQTAIRMGAQKVTMICLETENEMPAIEKDLQTALSEGVVLKCSWGNPGFTVVDGKLDSVEFMRCTKVFDSCGHFSPEFDSCELKSVKADSVIVAIGQQADMSLLEHSGITAADLSGIDPLTLQSSDKMIFLAGDVLTGPSTVIDAMAKGRAAAESAHRFVSGEHLKYERAYKGPVETQFDIKTDRGNGSGRNHLSIHTCKGNGDLTELEGSYDTETARKEAGRCYSCGDPFGKFRTCWFCLPCEVECPNDALYVEIPYLMR